MSGKENLPRAISIRGLICKAGATILFAIFWPPFAYVFLLPISDINYITSVPGSVPSFGFKVNLAFEVSVTVLLFLSIMYDILRIPVGSPASSGETTSRARKF